MKSTILSAAVLAGMLGLAACTDEEEVRAGGDSGLEAVDMGPDTTTTPLPEAGAAGVPGALPTTDTAADTSGTGSIRDTMPR